MQTGNALIVQIDLWSARRALPEDLSAVAVRMEDSQFSTRTRSATSCNFQTSTKGSDPAVCNIIELVYRSAIYEGLSKDNKFSRLTIQEYGLAGCRHATVTLAHPDVHALPIGPYSLNEDVQHSAGVHAEFSQTGKRLT